MDRVRFGRALGVGAREAAKAAMKAADAVTAPNPRATQAAGRVVAQKTAPVVERAKVTAGGVKRGGKSFGKAVWAPMVKAGGVLWLEVTGVLFGLFALVIGTWVFNQRKDFWGSADLKHRVWAGAVMFAFFAWMTVSSFLKARRKSRG